MKGKNTEILFAPEIVQFSNDLIVSRKKSSQITVVDINKPGNLRLNTLYATYQDIYTIFEKQEKISLQK